MIMKSSIKLLGGRLYLFDLLSCVRLSNVRPMANFLRRGRRVNASEDIGEEKRRQMHDVAHGLLFRTQSGNTQ